MLEIDKQNLRFALALLEQSAAACSGAAQLIKLTKDHAEGLPPDIKQTLQSLKSLALTGTASAHSAASEIKILLAT